MKKSIIILGVAVFLLCNVVMAVPGNQVLRGIGTPELQENTKIAFQIRLARIVNETVLTNEQLIHILTLAKSTKSELVDLKENVKKAQEEVLNSLIRKQPIQEETEASPDAPMKTAQTIINEYLVKIKGILTYEQGEKLERILSNGNRNQHRPIQQMQDFKEKAAGTMEKVVQSPIVDRLPENIKNRLESAVEAFQKREGNREDKQGALSRHSPSFSAFGLSFLTDWGIELLERYIDGK